MTTKETYRDQVWKHRNKIKKGTIMSLDPSSLRLGFAVMKDQVLINSGTRFAMGDIGDRLKQIREHTKKLLDTYSPDVLIIERLRAERKTYKSESPVKGYTNYSPIELLWSVGAALSEWGQMFLEISPASWKVTANRLNLPKSDENDALCMIIRTYELIEEEKEKRAIKRNVEVDIV